MHLKNRRMRNLILGVMTIPAVLFASPNISVDSADFDLGTLLQGEVQTAKHTFKFKNTGDSVLVIKQVKPG